MPAVILALKDLPWRGIALSILIALAVVTIAVAGWTASGWRWEARVAALHADHAAAAALASEQAREREQVLADAITTIDADHTAERTQVDAENSRLRAAVDAGAQRLRLAAHCPADRLPETAAGPRLDPGDRAELDASARPDYFALRAGLTRMQGKLSACQATLKAVTAP